MTQKRGRPKVKNPYNVKLGVAVNRPIMRALKRLGPSESGTARGFIIAALMKDGRITKDDLPHI
jgi:hypothetical protein